MPWETKTIKESILDTLTRGLDWDEEEVTLILFPDVPTPDDPQEEADKLVVLLSMDETFCLTLMKTFNQWWLEFEPLEQEGHSQLVLAGFKEERSEENVL